MGLRKDFIGDGVSGGDNALLVSLKEFLFSPLGLSPKQNALGEPDGLGEPPARGDLLKPSKLGFPLLPDEADGGITGASNSKSGGGIHRGAKKVFLKLVFCCEVTSASSTVLGVSTGVIGLFVPRRFA